MMDNELKQHLDEMEERLNARAEALEERLNARAEVLEERLDTRIEKVETNLLTAFHGWARAMEIRVRGVAGITTGFDERLALAEERISELERKRK
jgi:DNA repair exonuclease SbcCD ATPase subunit